MDILMNLQSGLLSADPGTSGTTLNSGNFAFLPVVASPNTMRLVLNPDGAGGTAPELVLVTAHTAAATSLTVVRAQETAWGGGAAVAHPIDTVWRHVITRGTMLEWTVPPGSIVATVAATADPGFVLIDGSTITNGQSLYPLTWARIPASWQSAPNIVLPDWRGKTLFMDDAGALFTLGGSGGANTHSLIQAELPAVTLSIDPPSTVVSIDPPSTAVTGSTGAGTAHHHDSVSPAGTLDNLALGSGVLTGRAVSVATTDESAHTHPAGSLAVDIAPFNATVDIAPFNSPALGSGTAIDTRPAHGVVNFQMKLH